MKQFYIHNGLEQKGPFTLEELKQQNIDKSTLVWYTGLTSWVSAEAIEELRPFLMTPPPFNSRTSIPLPYPEPATPKRKVPMVPILTGAGLSLACFVIWLIWQYNSQATLINAQSSQIEHVQQQQQQQSLEQQQKELERKRIDEELTRKNREYRNNWSNYIIVRNSEYKYSNLGGIYGLSVIVKNNTEYMLDEVVAYVRYIKANGDTWKTIEVPVSNIPANSLKSIEVPDVERAISVEVTTKSIVAKKLHFYYDEFYSSGNPEDPYFSK